MIECTKEIGVARAPEQVFAFIDAEDEAPRWLSRCIEISRTSSGAKAVGTTLRYVYKQGARRGTMHGIVTEYEPGKRLGMRYSDQMFEVNVGFDVAPNGFGAIVTERLSIKPKSLSAKLLTPLLRRVTRWQADRDMTRLKQLLETPG